MSRRKQTDRPDLDRLILLHEAADHLSIMSARRRLGSPETEGDRALVEAIEGELTREELRLVHRHVAGEDVHRRLSLPHYERLRASTYFVERARVRSGAGGWELLPGDGEVASLDSRRKRRVKDREAP